MKNERARLLRRMERLTGCRINDTVKLAFLGGEQLGEIDGLDLGALKEFKRSGGGVMELKLVNQAAVLEWLAKLSGDREGGAGEPFRALWENVGAVQDLFPVAEACARLMVFR